MPAVRASQPGDELRQQGPWERRNVAELLQTNFRTTLRGFDRDEVRTLLERVAADYRVLQMQNASLKRQLAHLEGVLQAYQKTTNSTAVDASVTGCSDVPSRKQPAPRSTAGALPVGNARNPAAEQERNSNGIRLITHTFDRTLRKLDDALIAIPALPRE